MELTKLGWNSDLNQQFAPHYAKENKCAVLEALAVGRLPRERYESFLKLQLEIRYLREAEKRAARQDRK